MANVHGQSDVPVGLRELQLVAVHIRHGSQCRCHHTQLTFYLADIRSQLLESATGYVGTQGSPRDDISSASTVSSQSWPEPRERAAPTHTAARLTISSPDKLEVRTKNKVDSRSTEIVAADLSLQRRRKQNRAAQRTFREREKRHESELKKKLSELQQGHHVLSRSCTEQQDQIRHLKAQVDRLNSRKCVLQGHAAGPCDILRLPPAEFDLVPIRG